MSLKRGDYMEYSGKFSKTIPPSTIVRVKCDSISQKTVVEAMRADGAIVSIVLSNKYLQAVRSLF